jgi:hypothetical protein
MSESTSRLPRLATEVVVIVGSILLAFAIDAWWDVRREAESRAERLVVLEEEFADVSDRLAEAVVQMDEVTSSTRSLLTLIGPSADPVPIDSLRSLVGQMFDLPAPGISGATLDRILSGDGLEGSPEDRDTRALLEQFRSDLDYFDENLDLLRDRRQDALGYLISEYNFGTMVPFRLEERAEFPLDVARLVRDGKLQGHLINYQVRAANIETRLDVMLGLSRDVRANLRGRNR